MPAGCPSGQGDFKTPSQIAYAASNVKKLAKALPGSGYFVDRRKA